MPVVKHGFLFAHFEKIVCGVVGLGILVAIVFVMLQLNSLSKVVSPDKAKGELNVIREGMARPATPVTPKDYATAIAQRFESTPTPQPLRAQVFFPPTDQKYAPVTVAPGKDLTLTFRSALLPGSVTVVGTEGVLQIIRHPVGDDYKKVEVRSLKEGEAEVEGDVGAVKHIIPVVVNSSAGKTAYPPSKVAVLSKMGGVTLEIQPNKQNDDQEVEVLGYEVWRRDWSDPLADYTKVGDTSSGEGVRPTVGAGPVLPPVPAGIAGMGGRGPSRPTGAARPSVPAGAVPAGLPGMRGPGVAAAAVTGVTWQDTNAAPGQRYSYKVCTLGSNTYPKASAFTDPVLVEVSPNVDFRFSRSAGGKVGFDVVKSEGGVVSKETFWVAEGDEIGGTTKEKQTYETGDFLVDFHRGVILPGAGVTDRAIYADRDGNLHVRVRNETKSDLWAAAEAPTAATPGLRGVPPGVPVRPGMPGPSYGPPRGAGGIR